MRHRSGAIRWVPDPSASSTSLQLAGSSTSSQDEATGGPPSPSCSLSPRVPHAAPLAVGVVHSLQQVCPSLPGLGGAWLNALQPEGRDSGRPSMALYTYFLMGLGPEAVISDPCLCLPGLMILWHPGSSHGRQLSRLQGSAMPAEVVSARVSLGARLFLGPGVGPSGG